MRKGLFGLALAGLFSSAILAAQQDLISAEDFGDAWPFTFEEGYVACHAGNAVTVMDGESGRMYPLNGAAKGKASALGLYYDSQTDLCHIDAGGGLTAESFEGKALLQAARCHISQFELLGIIGHQVG